METNSTPFSHEGEYAISTDGEFYHETYPSKEEAIADGRAQYPNQKVYVGRCVPPPQPEIFWDANDWLEKVACQDAYSLECAQDWDSGITNDQKQELETEVQKILAAWLDKHSLRPNFYLIEDAQEILPLPGETQQPSIEATPAG
jgi:hypothetical protein